MPAADDGLAEAVRTLKAPWRGTFFDSVDSTQDAARAAAKNGAPSRSAFVADFQRAGRGRQGRSWLAPPGTALLVSIVFRERTREPLPFRWTSLASLSLVEAVEALQPSVKTAIKWPNDVLIDTRKVAGVLAESSWNGLELVTIVGVGVNVSIPAADLEPLSATSLDAEVGAPVDRGALFGRFLESSDAWLARPADEVRGAWQARLWRSAQRVRLVDLGREQSVIVLGVEDDGALRIQLPDGTERTTTSAELIL
jgi:BirA family biotin operon repressor/biotin-[acetyl-CoA-carboxylase] ligase